VLRTDYAVIGGGVTGLSAAWALRRLNREVVLLDQGEVGHRDGGSHGACRIFRHGYDDPQYVMLARRARDLWAELEAACGERLLLPAPQLTFGPQQEQVRDAMLAAGAACTILTEDEAAERFPAIRTGGHALLEPDSAVIAASRALTALAALAAPAGAGPLLPGGRVTALSDDGRRVLISADGGDIQARRAIVCAGPWTADLVGTAGITVPATATLEQVSYLVLAGSPTAGSGPAAPAVAAAAPAAAGLPPGVPIFVHYGGEFPYGLPVPGSDRYKIGVHHGGPPVHPDRQDHAEDAGLGLRIAQAARSILPGYDPHPVAVERCVYDNSPDTDFIVDRIGNIVIGSGTSGHGFKFGPLLGAWLAWLAAGETPDGERSAGAPPARFALSRFSA